MNRILAWFLVALIFAMSGPLQAATMASARGFEKSLYGRSAAWADKYAYCRNNPVNMVDPMGLLPPGPDPAYPNDPDYAITTAIQLIRETPGYEVLADNIVDLYRQDRLVDASPFGTIGLTFAKVIYLDPDKNGFSESILDRLKELKAKRDCGKISQAQFRYLYDRAQAKRFSILVRTAATLVHEYASHYDQPIIMSQDKAEPPAYQKEIDFLNKVKSRFKGNSSLSKIIDGHLLDAKVDKRMYE